MRESCVGNSLRSVPADSIALDQEALRILDEAVPICMAGLAEVSGTSDPVLVWYLPLRGEARTVRGPRWPCTRSTAPAFQRVRATAEVFGVRTTAEVFDRTGSTRLATWYQMSVAPGLQPSRSMSLRTSWLRIPSGSGFLPGALTVVLLTLGSGSTPRPSDASTGFPGNEPTSAPSLLPGTPVHAPVQDSLFALATFDSVWSRIRSTYWDEDLGGLDWDGVRSELRPRAAAASSTGEVRSIITQMLGRLDQSHFVLMPSDIEPAFPSSRRTGSASPGLEVRWIDDELLITRVLDGAPAMDSDIGPGWILHEIDGLPVDSLAATIFEALHVDRPVDDGGLRLQAAVQSRLLGPPDSRVRLVVTDASGATRTRNLRRVEPPGELVEFGNLPPVRMEVVHRRDVTGSGNEVGIIRLTAWFPSAAPLLGRAIDELRGADGIILDLRGNPGGLGGLVMGTGGHFFAEAVSLGTMRSRENTLEFVVNPQRIGPDGQRVEPYDGPLAILVDPMTASTSEIFAGGLQALGRAVIIGETTAGQALPSLVVPLPNGDRLMHAVADFVGPDGTRLEGQGVTPDIHVPLDRDALLRDEDPVLLAALQWLDTR